MPSAEIPKDNQDLPVEPANSPADRRAARCATCFGSGTVLVRAKPGDLPKEVACKCQRKIKRRPLTGHQVRR